MTQYEKRVNRQALKLAAEEWANIPKSIHIHKLSSMWYDTRPQDTEQGHVIDPRTGRPTQAARVAAVVCQSATVSDAWATALLVAPDLELPEGLRIGS